MKKQLPIGKVIHLCNVSIKVFENVDNQEECSECYFYKLCNSDKNLSSYLFDMFGDCSSAYRKDKRDVIFKIFKM